MIKVWHRLDPDFLSDVARTSLEWPMGFELAAEVTSEPSMGTSPQEWAFYRTNNIDAAWTMNTDVKATRDRMRSTSTGDVVELPDGTLLMCASFGWQKIGGK